MKDEGYTPVKFIVQNDATEEFETLTLDKELDKSLDEALDLKGETCSRDDADMIKMMLYVKDRYNVSTVAYHEMASLCRQMPRSYKLKDKIVDLNSKWKLFPTPAGTVGVQQTLSERLQMCVKRLVSL